MLLLLPDFLIIVCGFLLCRLTPINAGVWAAVDKLVYYFLFPVLLFRSVLRQPLDVGAASQFAMAGVSLALLSIALAYGLAWLPGFRQHSHTQARDFAACAQIAFRFNSFVVLSVSERVMGEAGAQLVAILIGLCVPIFNVAAVWPMARHAEQGLLRELARNPLIYATVGGLTLNLLGWRIPGVLDASMARVGQAALGLGLLSAGAGMQWQALAQAKLLGAALLSIRHLISPLLALGLASAFALRPAERMALLAFSAAPTAASAHVLAGSMGFNAPLVASLVTLSTLLGGFSLALALSVLAGI